MRKEDIENRPVVIFDGVCNFCNSSVNWVLEKDSDHKFLFVAAQSQAGEKLLKPFNKDPEDLRTIYILYKNRLYNRSSAVLRIARYLPFPWKLLYAFVVIPVVVRDVFYNVIANNRYIWFGKSDACRLPSPEERARFVLELED